MKIHNLPSLTRTALTGCRPSEPTADSGISNAESWDYFPAFCSVPTADLRCTTHHITLKVLKQLVMVFSIPTINAKH